MFTLFAIVLLYLRWKIWNGHFLSYLLLCKIYIASAQKLKIEVLVLLFGTFWLRLSTLNLEFKISVYSCCQFTIIHKHHHIDYINLLSSSSYWGDTDDP